MQFVDLKKQYDAYKDELQREIDRVIQSCAFINGPAVGELEKELSDYSGAHRTIACSSGTDALLLPLMALGIGPGDEVIIPAFTFIATGSMVAHIGARPVFVDVDPVTFTMDPGKIEEKITPATKAIIPVSLYGQCAPMAAINAIAEKHGLAVIEDGAQSFGARQGDRYSCNLSEFATTSFFPAKPLGGYGDGGAVFCRNEEQADLIKVLSSHGQVKRYHHKYVGLNARMDTLQAAIIKVKLRHFAHEIALRNKAAAMYTEALKNLVETPVVPEGNRSTWAQYTIHVDNRDQLQARLKEKGVPTAVHYPVPLNYQEAFADFRDGGEYPVSEKLSQRVLSLPMHAFITDEEIETVCSAIKESI